MTPVPQPKSPQPARRNSIRIIGGEWRGRRVNFPALPGLRPTPDRVRETLYNWLQPSIVGTHCLDLFAGSGALGLEALSRGASSVVFVEQAQAAARSLVTELKRLRGSLRARVVEMGAARFLRTPGETSGNPVGDRSHRPSGGPFGDPCGGPAGGPAGGPFDIIFMDPPFGRAALAEFVPLLDSGGWVKPTGLVYLENEKSAGLPPLPAHWEVLKSKSAGEVGYHLVRVNVRAGKLETGS
jgi:16S rRNA (guanine966-N2)-methyltransferase